MLTDERALRLIEEMRHATQSADVAALCDWVLGLAQRRQGAIVAPAADDGAAMVAGAAPKPKAGRNAYMAACMRRRRLAQKK